MSRLLEAREKAALTQECLAERSGISQVHISRIETGARPLTKQAAQKLAKALAMRASDLLPDLAIEELRDDLEPEDREAWIKYGRFLREQRSSH